jgi:hypothetical protein
MQEVNVKTLTIRGIDPELDNKIKEKSRKSGESINKLILRLLRSSLGLGEKEVFPVYHDLDHLAGTWTEEDEKEFQKHIAGLEEIDKEMWE